MNNGYYFTDKMLAEQYAAKKTIYSNVSTSIVNSVRIND